LNLESSSRVMKSKEEKGVGESPLFSAFASGIGNSVAGCARFLLGPEKRLSLTKDGQEGLTNKGDVLGIRY